MRRAITITLVTLGTAALALSLRQACAPRPVAVGTVPVEHGVVERRVANSDAGTVRARRVARVAAERGGRVVSFTWRQGDYVRAGQVLLQVDATTAETQLHAVRHDAEAVDAAQKAAHAEHALAEREYQRVASLHARKVASDEDLDAVRARRDAAAAQLAAAEARQRSAEAAIESRTNEVHHLRVRMPFTGVITQRLVEEGESVVPGQAVAEVMTLDSLYVLAPLDERDAAQVARGLEARVTLDPFPGELWTAKVTRVAPVVEETREANRTLAIEVDLPARRAGPQPRPGMSADVEVVLERAPDVLRVPSPAVIEGRRVLVLVNGRAVAREVKTGLRNWDWTQVTSGLVPGERVITTLDRPGVAAGARVRAEDVAPADSVR
jgi:HlyD family secretion protein